MLILVSAELKRLICEVESQMEPSIEKTPLSLEDIKIKLPEKLDATNGFMQYRSILDKCTTFLKKSKKVLFGKDRKFANKKRNKRKQVRRKNIPRVWWWLLLSSVVATSAKVIVCDNTRTMLIRAKETKYY